MAIFKRMGMMERVVFNISHCNLILFDMESLEKKVTIYLQKYQNCNPLMFREKRKLYWLGISELGINTKISLHGLYIKYVPMK